MNFFNIGFPELILVLIIMLVFLGPERMTSGARSLARFISRVVRSNAWRDFFGLYKEIKQYPSQLMKEVQLEEINKEFKDLQAQTQSELNDINQELSAREKDFRSISAEIKKNTASQKNGEDAAEDNDRERGT